MKTDENPINVEEKVYSLEKRDKIFKKLREVLHKWSTIKYLSC